MGKRRHLPNILAFPPLAFALRRIALLRPAKAGIAAGVLVALAGLALLAWVLRPSDDDGTVVVAQPSSEPQSPAAQMPDSTLLPSIDWGWRSIADASCADLQHCWLGAGNDILASNDGGQHWTRQYQARSGDVGLGISRVEFVSKDHGWATTGVSLIETVDGGQTWHEVIISEPSHDPSGGSIPQNIDFVDDRDGFSFLGPALGAISLSRTEDGGRTWKPLQIPCPDSKALMASFDFISLTTGWYLCASDLAKKSIGPAELFRTTDSGETWERMTDASAFIAEDLTPFYDLAFIDEEDGWLSAGRGGLRNTNDGGRTWRKFAAWSPELLAKPDTLLYPLAEVSFISSGDALLIKNG